MKTYISLAVVDSHPIVRDGIRYALAGIEARIAFECSDTESLLNLLQGQHLPPDICIIDINNCGKLATESIRYIYEYCPDIKFIVFTDFFHDHSLLRFIRDGVNSCISKYSPCSELQSAVLEVFDVGYYFSTQEIATMARGRKNQLLQSKFLSDKEIEFLKLACSELTYKEIADQMCASTHTVESYRDDLFLRIGVKSRIGLVLFAIKNGLLTTEDIRDKYVHYT